MRDELYPFDDRNRIASNIALGMKIIVALSDHNNSNSAIDRSERAIKNQFLLILGQTMYPLLSHLRRKYTDLTDIDEDTMTSIVLDEFLKATLRFDPSINNNFFAYAKGVLKGQMGRGNVWTAVRTRLNQIQKERPAELVQVPIDPTDEPLDFSTLDQASDQEASVDHGFLSESLDSAIDELTPALKAAVRKQFFGGEQLSEAERKSKQRALEQLRQNHPELKDFLS